MKSVLSAEAHPLVAANQIGASLEEWNEAVGKLKFCEEQNRVLRAEINNMPYYEPKIDALEAELKYVTDENVKLKRTVARVRAVKIEALSMERDEALKRNTRLISESKKNIRKVIQSMAPWTRQQVKYLLSDASPLTKAQQRKMKSELHADPAMGHKRKGSKALKKSK